MRLRPGFLLQILACLLALAAVSPASPPRSLVLVQWSDIHFGNPAYVAAAWQEALAEGLALRPDVALLTGDQIDAACPRGEWLRRRREFFSRFGPVLRSLATSRPLIVCLGNNDLYPNYDTSPESLEQGLLPYRQALGPNCYLDDLGHGVYPRTIAGSTWITLNSMVFSPANKYQGRAEQARRTLEWLQETLRSLPSGRPVVLACHIPPTYDLWDHKPAWVPQDLVRLQGLLEGHRGPVAVVAGHFHRNEIHADSLPGGGAIPILVGGSLSEKYDNQPNWRTYHWTLDASGGLARATYRLRYPGRPRWSRRYDLPEPRRVRTYTELIGRLAGSPPFYEQYMRDLWAYNGHWRQYSQGENRQAALDQIFVRPPGQDH